MLLQPPSQPVRGPIAARHPAEVRPAVGVGPVQVEERRGDAAPSGMNAIHMIAGALSPT